jgi:hypothetical protein
MQPQAWLAQVFALFVCVKIQFYVKDGSGGQWKWSCAREWTPLRLGALAAMHLVL